MRAADRPTLTGPFVVALVVCLALAYAGAAPRLARGPLPAEVVAGEILDWRATWMPAGLDAFAGCLVALVIWRTGGLRRVAGGFGLVAAAAFATAISGAARGCPVLIGLPHASWWLPGAGAALAVGSSPLWRDRGIASLALIGLVIGAGVSWSRRAALGERRRAVEFAAWREALLEPAMARLYARVPADLPLIERQALALGVRPPYVDSPVDLVCVEAEDEEAVLLRAAGWRGVALDGDRPEPIEPAEEPLADRELRLEELTPQLAGERGLRVILRPARGRLRLRVVTPGGALRTELDEPELGLHFVGPKLRRFLAILAPLPADARIWLRVENVDTGASTPWQPLTLAGATD